MAKTTKSKAAPGAGDKKPRKKSEFHLFHRDAEGVATVSKQSWPSTNKAVLAAPGLGLAGKFRVISYHTPEFAARGDSIDMS